MKKLVRKLLLVFFLMVFLFSFWKVGSKLRHYDEGQGSYNQLEEYISYGGENSGIPSDDADSENFISASVNDLSGKRHTLFIGHRIVLKADCDNFRGMVSPITNAAPVLIQ